MTKKMFLNRQRAIHTTESPSVGREDIAPFSSRNIPASEQLPFRILDESSKYFPKFNATGRSLLIKFNSLGEKQDPTTYLKECLTLLTNHLVDKLPDRDLVGFRIRNTENVQDKVVGISLHRRDQLKADVVWSVVGKVIQSNAEFALTNRLEVHMDHVRMPIGNGREKTKGRSFDLLSAIKKSIVIVQAAFLCLAHALIIDMARVNNDPKYASYRDGYALHKPIEELLNASGVDLFNGGGFEELQQFQQYLSDYKIIVFDGLYPNMVMFSGNSISAKKLHLLCDRDSGHYNVIINLRDAMAKKYICNGRHTPYNFTQV